MVIAHIGLNSFPCGRLGEPASLNLTETIHEFGIMAGRLKTGTSPRIDGRTVDFQKWLFKKETMLPGRFHFHQRKHPKIKQRAGLQNQHGNPQYHS